MKKIFSTKEYKKRNFRRSKKLFRRRLAWKEKRKAIRRSISGYYGEKYKRAKSVHHIGEIIKRSSIMAPQDFRLIENTQECLMFFRDVRSDKYVSQTGASKLVRISLENVNRIDYGTISILTSISDDLKYKNIVLQGNFPKDLDCRKFITESGFLNHMVNEKNKPFMKSEKSELIFFEKGQGVLSQSDNIKISNLVKNVVDHLTGRAEHCLSVKTIILEICGNSIEWSGTDNKQWLLGVKYESDRVIFTVTDVGKGILETLYRKFG